MNAQPVRIGEIIAAGTTAFTAQCYELHALPPLGALVKTGEGERSLFAVVHHAATGSIEPGRKPIARGRDAAHENEIYAANPQLERLLRSEFAALVVGFAAGGNLHRYLPPHPARIHGFVHECTGEEIRAFSSRLGFLSLLLASETEVPAEELVAATLRHMAAAHPDPGVFLLGAGQELAQLLGRDYSRLKVILERIRP